MFDAHRILVTGGAGFIGSHVCEALLLAGHRVSIIDNLDDFYDPAIKRDNLAQVLSKGRVNVYETDIRDSVGVEEALRREKPNVVVHLAARAGVRPSIADPKLYFATNVDGTLTLLEGLREHAVRKLVFASSSSVYGDRSSVPFRESDSVGRPVSPYAATKLAGEQLIYTYCHLYGLRAMCLRFFTVYGPRQRPDLAIRTFYDRMRMGLPVSMFGDGSSGRDYTFISDIVDGVLAAVNCDASYETVNLGSGRPILLSETISEIARVLGVHPEIRVQDRQPGDVEITYADITKAEALLGYCPKVSFPEGIRRIHAWNLERRPRNAFPAENGTAIGYADRKIAGLPLSPGGPRSIPVHQGANALTPVHTTGPRVELPDRSDEGLCV